MFKKTFITHVLPIVISVLVFLSFKNKIDLFHSSAFPVSSQTIANINFVDHFYYNDLTNQKIFSEALYNGVPVLIGSSELTSRHLKGLAPSYFVNVQKSEFLAIGHAGFQSLAILTALAANRELLKQSKLTIIISPGWFEKKYAKGTSLPSFFEYCPPNYLYQLINDPGLDAASKNYIFQYINSNYGKISSPNALARLAAKKSEKGTVRFLNSPYNWMNESIMNYLQTKNQYLTSQHSLLEELTKQKPKNYTLHYKAENWDSLFIASRQAFKLISNTNTVAVENNYYEQWLKGKDKKNVEVVRENENQELKDFKALADFLKVNQCNPIFIITPLNTKAHQNLEKLQPTITQVKEVLTKNNFETLDMFSSNLKNYEDGVLEDIMHPYDYGWYQIDKFILDNYSDKHD